MTDRAFAGAVLAVMLAMLALLSGCAQAPVAPNHRYLLTTTGVPDAPPENTARRLWIAPLRLAPFLQTEGIVMQTGAVTIHQGRNHLWAEDLATQLRHHLRQELARKLQRTRVLDNPAPSAEPPRRLEVEVDDFQGRYDGMAVVAGQWRLLDGKGRLLASRRFSIERPLAADGYEALVKSLAAAWQSVADEIAPAVAASW